MGETGFVRFPGSLDPRAQEFWPGTTTILTPQFPLFGPPQPPLTTPVFFPYTVETLPFNPQQVQYPLPLPPPPPEGHVLAAAATSTSPASLPPPSRAPTRTILLSSVPRDATEYVLRRDMETFGGVRGVQMERILEGIVAVHFYDLRHSERALKEVRAQHMHHQTRLRDFFAATTFYPSSNSCFFEPQIEPPPPQRGLVAGRPVWAQFIIPSCNSLPDGNNQGTIVVFNLDPNVSTSHVKEIFHAFGAVKEARETPFKKQQRFVEFYDVRDAAKALREMNGKEIHGKQAVIEFSRPGGFGRKLFNAGVPVKATSGPETFSVRHAKFSRIALPPTTPPLSPPLPGWQTSRFVKRFSGCGEGSSTNHCAVGNGSIEASIGCMSLSGEKKNGSGYSNDQTSTSKQQQHKGSSSGSRGGGGGGGSGNRSWRCKQSKKLDSRFLINEDAKIEANSNDSRTTVMIKNIPNKYSQKLLLNMLDNHCIHCNEQIADGDDQPLSSYDFLYLPIDFNNKCNVGYGFVNMTSPQATMRLYKAFHLQHWEVFNSRKICEVTYARVQGLEALKEHFKNSKFPCEMGHYLPVVFSPPRDGRQLTDPLPIAGHPNRVPSQPMILGLLPQTTDLQDGHQVEDLQDHLKNSNGDQDGGDSADADVDNDDGWNEPARDSI